MTRRYQLLLAAVLLVGLGALAWDELKPPTVSPPRAVGPDLRVDRRELSDPLQIVAYGDIRFTNPRETNATNPKVRRWLVERIAAEKPDTILLSGDVPWHGGSAGDYAVYRAETQSWQQAHLHIYPALGNHEFQGLEKQCLDNWWNTFPELRGLRYYAVQLGDSVYVLNLDSNSAMTPGSRQMAWLNRQVATLPASVRFVFLNLHHPPVVDEQQSGDPSHNGRPNETALAKFLASAPQRSRVRFIVNAGHVHNYERFDEDGVIYLVSGGGGAKPLPVVRGPRDLYQDPGFPNYHYVKFVVQGARLQGTMIRIADPDASMPSWEEKDHFETKAFF